METSELENPAFKETDSEEKQIEDMEREVANAKTPEEQEKMLDYLQTEIKRWENKKVQAENEQMNLERIRIQERERKAYEEHQRISSTITSLKSIISKRLMEISRNTKGQDYWEMLNEDLITKIIYPMQNLINIISDIILTLDQSLETSEIKHE